MNNNQTEKGPKILKKKDDSAAASFYFFVIFLFEVNKVTLEVILEIN